MTPLRPRFTLSPRMMNRLLLGVLAFTRRGVRMERPLRICPGLDGGG